MKLFSLMVFTLFIGGTALSQNKGQHRIEKGNFKMTASPTVVTSPRSEEPKSETPKVMAGVSGTVQVSTECGTYLEVSEGGTTKKYFVTNLPEEHNVHGKSLVFDYVEDHVRFPSNCGFTNAIKLNNVKNK